MAESSSQNGHDNLGKRKAYNSESSSTAPIVADGEYVDGGEGSERRQIGLFSAVFIIFNRIIGTGVFATPSTILSLSGSVGLSLFMWIIGAVIAAAGMQVYIIWGTALPKNGGEKNYLEYLFRKPKFLITSVYAANGVLLAWAAGNSLVFGEYILRAANREPGRWTLRLVGFACITFALILHGTALKWGLRLQNFLGIFKILVLLFVIITGFVALGGHMKVEKPHNFSNAFEGTTASASSFCLSLYNVIWSYIGFSNVNYALSEVKNPARTIRIAGPLAIGVVTVLYMLANVAYFAGASKEEITSSGRLVAALLFRNVYGPRAERALSAIVALSALGNVLSVVQSSYNLDYFSFAHGERCRYSLKAESTRNLAGRASSHLVNYGARVVRSMPRWLVSVFVSEIINPQDRLFLTVADWAVCLIVIFALPPGDAYNFVINVISYPLSVINAAISFGIVYLAFHPYSDWPSVSLPAQLAAAFFGSANVFLFIVPLTRPPEGGEPYKSLPYWTHAVAGWAVFGLGFLYWVLWAHVIPRVGRYTLVRQEETGTDGLKRWVFRRVTL
ncbi:amino acid/polyamine transporter I [Infundibulicybe gibba]|nr:amino acid/polyamine transporter I [Infundibulicybe gibba]